jgi:hypothetical protein
MTDFELQPGQDQDRFQNGFGPITIVNEPNVSQRHDDVRAQLLFAGGSC